MSEITELLSQTGPLAASVPGFAPRPEQQQMAEAVAKTAGIDAARVGVRTLDISASWVMEGGALLPEPGDEEAWLAQHA